MVRDVLFELRQEKGLRVKGLFVDRERKEGHVDDIVVMLDKGTGAIFYGTLADKRMQLAVRNAIEAAVRYSDEDPGTYDLSWQVRNVWYQYEGDSLGLAIAISVIARLLDQQIPQDLAFTGVVTKDGEITRVGGIQEKVKAAREAGISKVVIPFANKGEFPDEFLHEFVEPVSTLEEALHVVFPNLYEIYFEPMIKQTLLRLNNIKREKYQTNLYVNRTQVEREVDNFLRSDKSGLVILGHSGVGKTNLVGHLVEKWIEAKHLVLMYLCSALSDDLERTLEKDLGGTVPLEKSLKKLNQIASKWNTHVILLFDGINEYSYREKTPAELLRDIDNFIVRYTRYSRVKVILTCRNVTWTQLERLGKTELCWERYYNIGEKNVLTLQEFTPEEFQMGYGLYQQAFDLQTDFDKLSEQTKQRCRDPLMLRLVAEVNRSRRIPWDAPTFAVFAEYFEKRVGHQLDALIFLNNMVEEMFNSNSDALSLSEMHNSGKFKDIDSQSLQATYTRLKDQ